MKEILFRSAHYDKDDKFVGFSYWGRVDMRQNPSSDSFKSPSYWHGRPIKAEEQYIGVKGYEGDYENRHKNEVKLFEGDIVEAMSEGLKGTFVVKFRNEAQPTFMLFPAWQGGKMWSIAASDVGRAKGDYYDDLKRIGNIHDNPELINP
jgi:hypothetical protein